MKAVITGATGFIGYHLTAALLERGWQVGLLVRASANLDRLRAFGSNVSIHVVDETIERMFDAFSQTRPEVVFHAASLAISSHTSDQVPDLVRSNILLPALVLEAMAHHDVGRFVNLGSAWQNYSGPAYDPVGLYAATKQSCEDFIEYYAKTDGLNAVSLKPFHVYGPGDHRQRLLNLLCMAARSGEDIRMSPGRQVINLVHVDDVVSGMLAANDLMSRNELAGSTAFSMLSDRSLTVRDLVKLVSTVTGRPINAVWGALPYKQREFMAPVDIGPTLPGWRPVISLEEGVRQLYEEVGAGVSDLGED